MFDLPAAVELSPQEQEMLLRAVAEKRDQDAFAELFAYFAPRVKSFLMKGGAAPDQADEWAQETLLAVWHKAAQYNPATARPSTWIFTIARNKRIDALRKIRRIEPDPSDPVWTEETESGIEQKMDQARRDVDLKRVLKDLTPAQRDLLHKSFFEDKSHGQIAAETGMPLGTVKSRIRQTLAKLRGALGERGRP